MDCLPAECGTVLQMALVITARYSELPPESALGVPRATPRGRGIFVDDRSSLPSGALQADCCRRALQRLFQRHRSKPPSDRTMFSLIMPLFALMLAGYNADDEAALFGGGVADSVALIRIVPGARAP